MERTRRFGLPYQGSKNSIAQWVVEHFPPATHFFDLFSGGCAVTHAAILSGKFKEFHINDIEGDVPRLFVDAINGCYADERRWISRDDFFMFKDTDAYIRLCWSFSNNGKTYLYNETTENLKKNIWGVMTARTVAEAQSAFKRFVQSLESLERLQISATSYDEVVLCDDAVIYCDPPYRNTEGYRVEFDHDKFYKWVAEREQIVYISEYTMPDDFVKIDSIRKVANFSGGNRKNTYVEESLWVHKKHLDKINKTSLF